MYHGPYDTFKAHVFELEPKTFLITRLLLDK